MASRSPFLLITIVVAEESEFRARLFVDVGLRVEQFVGLLHFRLLKNIYKTKFMINLKSQ